MKHILILFCLLICRFLNLTAQNSNDIQICWIDAPETVTDCHLTLKWGIKSKSQITDISIKQNGTNVKGINAVTNDGYDMKKSQVLILESGENVIEISVSTFTGSKKSSRTITFLKGDENHDDFVDHGNIDSVIVAAYGGDAKAQYLMAKAYLSGRNGLEKDLFESSLWFKKSAEHLYAPSQYEYAIALLEGRGILKNPTYAISWLVQSADDGYAEAQLRLGLCYEIGEGVSQNIDKAKELYRKCPLPEAKQRLMALEN